jgi:hypothetical protein
MRVKVAGSAGGFGDRGPGALGTGPVSRRSEPARVRSEFHALRHVVDLPVPSPHPDQPVRL